MNATKLNAGFWKKNLTTISCQKKAKTEKLWLKILFVVLILFTAAPSASFAIDLKGNIDKDSTIRVGQSPCNITGDVYIRNGATLTFESGVIVNFMNAGYDIFVGYSASSLGKLNADGVTFNGYGPVNVDELIFFRYNSTGTLTNCTFNNVSVVMNESSPTVSNSSFDNCVYPLEFQNECSPVLSNLNLLSAVTNQGIKLNGTVNSNWTLQNYGYPYFVTAAMTVSTGATFTIAENDTINFAAGYAINIGSNASSLGNLIANKVIFKGVTNSTADQLAFRYGSTGKVTNCSFTAADLTCNISSPEIKNNTFNNAFISLTESSPTIQDNTFDNTAYPVLFIDECSPVLTNLNMLSGVTNRGIRLTGTVNKDWTLQNYGYPYFVTAAMTVNAGAAFTIAENDTINFAGGYTINVGSNASSLGNLIANKVIFKGVTNSTADQLAFRYGSTGKVTNCSFTAADLTCNISAPEIRNNAFDNAFISLTESSPTIQDNTFDNTAYPVLFIDECSPTLTNLNMLSGVTNRGIRLTGTVNKDWTLQNYGYPYFVTATYNVNAGATFTIAENDTINFVGGYAINIGSSASSLGTLNADKVIFKGVTNSTSDQLAFKYGSTGKVTNCSFTDANLTCSASSPEIQNNTFNNALISLNESSPIIQDNTFDNVTYPIEFVNECSPTLANLNMLSGVTNRGIRLTGTVNTDWTLQNYGYPYFVTAAMTVNTGATFTIAENDTINFAAGYTINVGSNASSLGTLNADKVIFKGVTNSTADQLAFKFGSTGKITNCSFTAADLTCNLSSPEIINNTFDNAFISLTESSPTIQDNTFDNTAYPVLFIDECSPVLTNLNMLNGVTNRGIRISGTVNSEWTLLNYGYPYYLPAALTINTGGMFTSAPDNTIFFNGVNLSVGSSTTSIGKFNARRNVFKNLRTTDNLIYYRYGSTGELDSCTFTGIRIHIDASNPKITRSKFHKSQNAIYTANNAEPEISNNIFYNNTLALKNAGTQVVTAKNNYWGHKTGPIHPDNPQGLGEKIEGLVDFSDISLIPVYGAAKSSFSVNSLAYDSTMVGDYRDSTFTVKSYGDIDLLIPGMLFEDPSFRFQTPSTQRAWVENGDSLNITVRFRPREPKEYDISGFVLTNDVSNEEFPLQLTGTGTSALTFSPETILFDSVYYGATHTQYLTITNITQEYSISVDSIVNHNYNFTISQSTKPSLSKIKEDTENVDSWNELEDSESSEQKIVNTGFPVYKSTPAYIAIEFTPYKALNDTDSIYIYYNGGGVHKVQITASVYADTLSSRILSLDYRQFPNIYMNIQVDTFAVNLTTLTEEDIEIYEDEVLQTEGIKITPPGEGNNTRLTDIVFIMDNSGSLGNEQAAVRENVTKFLTSLNESGINFALGLCRYGASENSGNPIIEDNGVLTQDADYFRDDIWKRNVVSGGSEPGYYAIMESASKFKFRPGSQKIFIIITDETPRQGSNGTLEKATEACQNNKITLFALTINDLFSLFKPITDITNGRVFNITSEFDIILQLVSGMVSDNFVVQYTSSNKALDGNRRYVEVRIKYSNKITSDTTSYVPGAIPNIVRTKITLDLHTKAWAPNTPLTIEVDVYDSQPPFVNDVVLNYRTSGTTDYSSIPMTTTNGVLYSAQIPDSVVMAPGVDYYITASDGMVSSNDPAIDALTNPYQVAVLPNVAPVIEHTPIEIGYYGNDIAVEATVTDNTNLVAKVELHYRKKGQLSFNKSTMNHQGNNIYKTEISKRFSSSDDIEYYIKAIDDFGVSSYAALPDVPYVIEMQNAAGLNLNEFGNGVKIYPNPVTNGSFVINFDNADKAQKYRLTLINTAGMKLTELYNDYLPAGNSVVPVQLKGINNGVYFVEIRTESDVYFRKLVVE